VIKTKKLRDAKRAASVGKAETLHDTVPPFIIIYCTVIRTFLHSAGDEDSLEPW
jgi:hypothetical protein